MKKFSSPLAICVFFRFIFRFIFPFIFAFVLTLVGFPVLAQEFRTFKPISTPGVVPEGAVPVKGLQPVQPDQAKEAVQEIFKAWNEGEVSNYLSQEFYDKTKLSDNLSEKVSGETKVRLMSIQGVQTQQQYQRISPATQKAEIISTVSVTATTQIELNDPAKGFRRLEGTNEYILRITEEIVP